MSGKLVNKPAPPVEHEVCDEESIYRVNDGGMDLDKTNLPSTGWLPELTLNIVTTLTIRLSFVCV